MIRTDKAEMSKLLRAAHNEAIEIAAGVVDERISHWPWGLTVLQELAASIRARKITEE
jgi:hypothetical protein